MKINYFWVRISWILTFILSTFFIYAQGPGGVPAGLWFKAGTGTNNTAGGSAATDGQTVEEWLDQGSMGYDFLDVTSGTSTDRPTLKDNSTDNWNGYPIMRFDGTDFLATVGNTGIIGSNSTYTKIVVNSVDGPSPNPNNLLSGSSGGGSHALWYGSTATMKIYHATNNYIVSAITSGEDVTRIGTARYNAGNSTPNNIIGVDGRFVDNGDTDRNFTDTDVLEVGSFNGANFLFGNIAEVILYTTALSDTDLQKVESYLAIKYGITLFNVDILSGITEGDYISSDDIVVWDESANSTYHNDVAGIARDNGGSGSALNHVESKSNGSDAILTVSVSSFASDLQYFMWGNDDGAIALTTTGAETDRSRLTRIWKSQETGTGGDIGANLTLEVDVSGISELNKFSNLDADDFTLLVDGSDTDFSDATATAATTFSSNTVTFTNVDIDDGDFFTLGTPLRGPGGLTSNLVLWTRGDNQVYNSGTTEATNGQTVETWVDQSLQGNDLASINPNEPDYLTASLNFNPVVDFDDSNSEDLFTGTAAGLIGGNSEYTKFVVHLIDDTSTPHNIMSSGNSGNHALYYNSTNKIRPFHNGDFMIYDGTQSTGIPYIASMRYGGATRSSILKMNGDQGATTTGTNNFSDGFVTVGSYNGSSNYLDGQVAEVAFFGESLVDSDIQKVEGYLALKYGITLDDTDENAGIEEGDYVASDGGIVWDQSANSTYHNDVAGIGRDDLTNLEQVKSQSENSGVIITIANGTSISSPSTLSTDDSFMIWGNDGGANTFTETVNNDPSGTSGRLVRVWKVQETGTIGNVRISIPDASIGDLDGSAVSIIIHTTDPTFPVNGRNKANMTYVGTDPTDSYEVTYDFPSGTSYFSFANASAATLPIELLRFDVQMAEDNDQVLITWITTTEINNDFFIVEKSLDGKNWDPFRYIEGAGNSSQMINYYEYDSQPFTPVTYYRLKQTDFDGRFSYSEIRGITIERNFTIYPIPATDQLIIQFDENDSGISKIQVRDLSGRMIRQEHVISERSNKHFLDLTGIPDGIYFLEIGENHIQRYKIIVK